VEFAATSVMAKVFQLLPSSDHWKVRILFSVFLAAQSTVIFVYPIVEKLFEKSSVRALELDPAAALLPPEKVGVVDGFPVLIVHVLEPDDDQPVGNVVPVPKFWLYSEVTCAMHLSEKINAKKSSMNRKRTIIRFV
jgi:hypothetical protein